MTNGAPATGHVTHDWLWTRVNILTNTNTEKNGPFLAKNKIKIMDFYGGNIENLAQKSRYLLVI